MGYAATRLKVARSLPKNGIGAEIGVWKGDYSAILLREATPECLHLIDPWSVREDPSHASAWYGAGSGVDMDAILRGVVERFAPEIGAGQVVIHRAPSTDAMAALAADSLDFVYVDGDHAYDGVKADLEISVLRLKPGGWLCVDDHQTGKWWGDGVVRAANELLGAYPRALQVLFCSDSQMVIQKTARIASS
ncbi:MAG: class I SAM-dependent methyltransferase [Pseudomonadota bacterium]